MAELISGEPVNADREIKNRGLLTPEVEAQSIGRVQVCFDGYLRPCLAEFVGLVIFVFTGCMAVQDPISAAHASPSAVCVAVAHGFTIALLVASFGAVR